MRIKKGDIVVCTNIGDEFDTISTPMLTLGKSYVVINYELLNNSKIYITVRNDVNIIYGYYDCRFSTLREERKKKLDKLFSIAEL